MPPGNAYLIRLVLLGIVWLVGLIASGWAPFDRQTWLMEVAPVFIAMPVLWFTRRSTPLTTLAPVSSTLPTLPPNRPV